MGFLAANIHQLLLQSAQLNRRLPPYILCCLLPLPLPLPHNSITVAISRHRLVMRLKYTRTRLLPRTVCLLYTDHGPLHSLPLRYDLGSVHSTSSRLTREDRTRIHSHSHKPGDQGKRTVRTYAHTDHAHRVSKVHAPGRGGNCTPTNKTISQFTQQILNLPYKPPRQLAQQFHTGSILTVLANTTQPHI